MRDATTAWCTVLLAVWGVACVPTTTSSSPPTSPEVSWTQRFEHLAREGRIERAWRVWTNAGHEQQRAHSETWATALTIGADLELEAGREIAAALAARGALTGPERAALARWRGRGRVSGKADLVAAHAAFERGDFADAQTRLVEAAGRLDTPGRTLAMAAEAAEQAGHAVAARRLRARARFALRRQADHEETVVGLGGPRISESIGPMPWGLIPAEGFDIVDGGERVAIFREWEGRASALAFVRAHTVDSIGDSELAVGAPWLRFIVQAPTATTPPPITGRRGDGMVWREPSTDWVRGGLELQVAPIPGEGTILGFHSPKRDTVLRWSPGRLSLFELSTGELIAEAPMRGAPGRLHPLVQSSSSFAVGRDDGTSVLFDRRLYPLRELDGELVHHPLVDHFAAVTDERVQVVSQMFGRLIADLPRPVDGRLLPTMNWGLFATNSQFLRDHISLDGTGRWLLDAGVEGKLAILDIERRRWNQGPYPVPGLAPKLQAASVVWHEERACVSGFPSDRVVDLPSGRVSRLHDEVCAMGPTGSLVIPHRADRELLPIRWAGRPEVASAVRGPDGIVAYVERSSSGEVELVQHGNATYGIPSVRIPWPLPSRVFDMVEQTPIEVIALDAAHAVVDPRQSRVAWFDFVRRARRDIVSEAERLRKAAGKIRQGHASYDSGDSLWIQDHVLWSVSKVGLDVRYRVWNLTTGESWEQVGYSPAPIEDQGPLPAALRRWEETNDRPESVISWERWNDADRLAFTTSDGRLLVLEASTEKLLATASITFAGDRLGLVAFLDGGYVDLWGDAPPPLLLCVFGHFATDYHVCRDRWSAPGGFEAVILGRHYAPFP